MTGTYQDFLSGKIRLAHDLQPEPDPGAINPHLKDFTKVIVDWAYRGGRRAIFASFGLHKTATQLELMRLVGEDEYRLIVLPLGVRQEFFADAQQYFEAFGLNLTLKFVRSDSEIEGPETIYLTNYETIRENKIDLSRFKATSLDEADILRSFGSKQFGELQFGAMQQVPLRWVATATPSPNDYLELIAYAHYLGIMDMGESKTRFFKRDSEHADNLTLLEHKVEEFWLWVSTWALFIQKPSDLGFSDEGYDQPELEVYWHEVPTDHSLAAPTKGGQGRLLKDESLGVSEEAQETRSSLPARMEKLLELRELDPDRHRILWHNLEIERWAIEAQCDGVVSVYGTQSEPEKEDAILGFRDGRIAELAAKPMMLGGGVNFQKHCSWAIFVNINHKFRDFIQAIHRLRRFGQTKRVRIDIIYSEAQRGTRASIERKWQQHNEQFKITSDLIRKYGLSHSGKRDVLERSMGCERREESGDRWKLVNNDSVLEYASMPDNSLDLIVTSIPFSTQYEYTPSYNDFGHTDDDAHFFAQMDFLSPQLLRTLKPGRVAAFHVKDRVIPGDITGLGYQTVSPFTAQTLMHLKSHGFTFMGMITVVTDVVRENAQTYRLSWSIQCKDGSRMGAGMPEYILLFRKAPTNSQSGWADERVAKTKDEYTRGRWQMEAHGFWRSSGNRLLTPEDFTGLSKKQIFRMYRQMSKDEVYDHERSVAIAEKLDMAGVLPPDFMLCQPWSDHPDVWSDVVRMQSLNSRQVARRRDKHLCPLPYDIVERLIRRFSNEGDIVSDPFCGVGTTPLVARKMGRQGHGCELNPSYWADSVFYLREAENDKPAPSLFDLVDIEVAEEDAA